MSHLWATHDHVVRLHDKQLSPGGSAQCLSSTKTTELPLKSTQSFVLPVNKANFKVEEAALHSDCVSEAHELAKLEQKHFWAVVYYCFQCKQKHLVHTTDGSASRAIQR